MSFQETYKKYFPQILKYLHSYLPEEESYDLAQEVFLTYYHKSKEISLPPEKVPIYLKNIAINFLKNRNKKQALQYGKLNRLKEKEEESSRKDTEIEKIEEKIFLEQILNQFLSRLNHVEKSIFILHKIEKLKHEQIAEILGISSRTVKRILRRTLEKFYDLKT